MNTRIRKNLLVSSLFFLFLGKNKCTNELLIETDCSRRVSIQMLVVYCSNNTLSMLHRFGLLIKTISRRICLSPKLTSKLVHYAFVLLQKQCIEQHAYLSDHQHQHALFNANAHFSYNESEQGKNHLTTSIQVTKRTRSKLLLLLL